MEEHRDRSILRPPRGRGKAVQIGGDGMLKIAGAAPPLSACSSALG
jgi:hypothetical protein